MWRFSISGNAPSYKKLEEAYVKLSMQPSSSLAISKGEVKVEYHNTLNDSAVAYQIWEIDGDALQAVTEDIIVIKAGSSFIDVPFDKIDRLKHGRSYLFKLKNSGGEEWMMKFVYYKPEN